MSGFRAQSVWIALMLAAVAPLLAGCDEPNSASAAAQQAEPDVSIVTVQPQPLAMVRELPGRVAPTRVADVRPRVSGIVTDRMFRQGSTVKAGDPLYRIDPRPFEVEVQANEAALARAEAVLQQASQHARRIATLAVSTSPPKPSRKKPLRPCSRREPTSKAERLMSRVPSSISTTRPSAHRSMASSARP